MKFAFSLGCYKNNSRKIFVSPEVSSLCDAWNSVSPLMAKYYRVKKIYPSQVLVKCFLGWALLKPLLDFESSRRV